MSCEEFWDRYPELSLPGEVPPHALECAECGRRLADQRALAGGLRALAEDLREIEAPQRVESGLRAAFRSQHVFEARPRRFWLPVLTWASAAALLVTLAMFVIRAKQPVAPRRAPARSVELAVTASPLDFTVDSAADSEDFIPLPNAAQMDPNEDVNVVRVEVPRSAMMAVGLSVAADRASELVEADVMLGSDGLARAVRFVTN